MPTASGSRSARVNVLAAAFARSGTRADGRVRTASPPPSAPCRVHGAAICRRSSGTVTAQSAGPRPFDEPPLVVSAAQIALRVHTAIGYGTRQILSKTTLPPKHVLRPNGRKSRQKSASNTLITLTVLRVSHTFITLIF